MKKADKQAKEIVDKFNMKPSILIEVEPIDKKEIKTYIEKQRKDFIDFIRSCETFYCLNKSVYGESSKCLEQCLACRKK